MVVEPRCPICGEKGFFHVDDHTRGGYFIRNLRKEDNMYTPTGRMAIICAGCRTKFLLDDGKKAKTSVAENPTKV